MTVFSLPRALISVAGPDAVDFLDRLLSNDVPALGAGPNFAALLSPQGKIVADVFAWRLAETEIVLDAATHRADEVLRRLIGYRLRARVEIAATPGAVTAGSNETRPDPRLAELSPRRLDFALAPPSAEPEGYRAHRVALGVPDASLDAGPEELFPGEALMDELRGVDFKKGCFVGQENVSRMKRRATTRRKFCRIRGAALSTGASIQDGEIALGEVRAIAGETGLALIRLDRALESAAAGRALTSDGSTLKLDPPAWLILPTPEA